jgi:hypothetical protein
MEKLLLNGFGGWSTANGKMDIIIINFLPLMGWDVLAKNMSLHWNDKKAALVQEQLLL